MLEKFTDPITCIGGTGRLGDPTVMALAGAYIGDTLTGRNPKRIAVVTPDIHHLAWWANLNHDPIRQRDRLAQLSPPNNWQTGNGATIGASRIGDQIAAHRPDVVVVVGHPDDRPAGWQWLLRNAKAEKVVVINTAWTGQEWRLFGRDDSELPELARCTLANDDKAYELTVTGTSWRPDENAPEFDSGIPLTADFKWTNGGKAPDISKWRDAVEATQLEAEQDEARRWFEAFRPDPNTIPPALAAAAPWLAPITDKEG